jgi:hypothetical protein
MDRDGFDLGFYAALIALGIVLGAFLGVGDARAFEPPACTEDVVLVHQENNAWACGPAFDDVEGWVPVDDACPYMLGQGQFDDGRWTSYVCVTPVREGIVEPVPLLPDTALPILGGFIVPLSVARRRDGEDVPLPPSDARRVWDAYYAHCIADVSLDLGDNLAALQGGLIYTRRQMLESIVRMAGTQVRLGRAYTTQGSPIFTITTPESPYRPMRMAIGIGETWTDAVARAFDMWVTGT